MEQQITKGQAIEMYDSSWWDGLPDRDVVKVQLFSQYLCMPFNEFHRRLSLVLGRDVYTHEFAYPDNLRHEFLGNTAAPTFEQILGLIQKDKRVLIVMRD